MKTQILRYLLCSIFLFSSFYLKAQINVSDSLALVDLYNNTNGPNWKDNRNWLTSEPVNKWKGVGVSKKRVTTLSLVKNRLKGTMPESLGNLTALTFLNFAQNQLTGKIPVSIGNLVNLTDIDFSTNLLNDTIPSSIGNLTSLTYLTFSYNAIIGKIPTSVCNLSNLQDLFLEQNKLTGTIPENIGNLKNLREITFATNQLTGDIPASFYKLTNLADIFLSYNQLTGTVSEEIGNIPNLVYIYLDHNQLSGSIPSSIGNLKKLILLYLGYNNFTGSIPASLQNCKSLNTLYIRSNQLSGSIPGGLANIPYLEAIYADFNNLTGSLPSAFFKSTGTGTLDFAYNHLSSAKNGSIPDATLIPGVVDVSHNDYNFNGLEFIASKVTYPYYTSQPQLKIHKKSGQLAITAGGTLANNTYHWFKVGRTDSLLITGDSTYKPLASGKYYAKVTNALATKLTLYTDTISFTVSSGKTSIEIKLQIFPNPVHDLLTVNGLNNTADYKISIVDTKGQVILNASCTHQQNFSLAVSHLHSGNYTVYVREANDKVSSMQFLKD